MLSVPRPWRIACAVVVAIVVARCSDDPGPQPTLSQGSAGSDSAALRLADAASAQDGATLDALADFGPADAATPGDSARALPDPDAGAALGDLDGVDTAVTADAGVDAGSAPADAATAGEMPAAGPDVPPPPPDVAALADVPPPPDAVPPPPDVPPPPVDVPPLPPDVPPLPVDVPPPPPDAPPPPKDTAFGPKCGDGTCNPGESNANCAADCPGGGAGTWTCGDKKCDIGEQFYCEGDCPGPVCGDGKCQWPENKDNCTKDCKGGGLWVCGDGKCDLGEQFYCAQDCQPPPMTCLAAKCGKEWQTCAAKPGCEKAVQCAVQCNGSWSCSQNCMTGGAANNKEAIAVLVCGQTQSCL